MVDFEKNSNSIKKTGHCATKCIQNFAEKNQSYRVICLRATTASKLKNAVFRKMCLKII